MEPETILLVYEFLFWIAVWLLVCYGVVYLLTLIGEYINRKGEEE